ncbi:MAG: hypothetical protein JNK30_04985 [Phenylobacterium sp.]|uniref:hypothetical protein n=1 Tax=Phenylobacterium sp. TaxID=1871053 RepID=UPI001A3C63DD|nr:hypothetical protein [Phenylobacterium sp.]MBL8770716.1 hypothetical protein [Phenylobacterium sp.]
MRALFAMVMLALAGCASGGGASREVSAVVENEQARQAAVDSAQAGADSEAALKAGAAAAPAPPTPAPGDPPN